MTDHDSRRVFAVLDPRHEGNAELIAAIGTDAVEMEEYRPEGLDAPPALRVKLRAIPEARVVAACRLIGDRTGIGFQAAYLQAVVIEGLGVCPFRSRLCADPEVGRDYYKNRDREIKP